MKCYLEKNLGDDLLCKCFADRYGGSIIATSTSKYNTGYLPPNIKIVHINKLLYYLSIIGNKIMPNTLTIDAIISRFCKSTVVVGGSMFIEGKDSQFGPSKKNSPYGFLKNKMYYIVGSNIGPYHTKAFVTYIKHIFKNSIRSTVRDNNSYRLLRELKNVNYSTDLSFIGNYEQYTKDGTQKAIVSIIDCNAKKKQFDKNVIPEDYYKKISAIIRQLLDLKYEVVLFSFCKKEGDENAINELLAHYMDNESKSKINIYKYDGNLEEALHIIGQSNLIIGSRLHANILGILMKKNIIPIIYNNKTREFLRDINFVGLTIELSEIEKFNPAVITPANIKGKNSINKYLKNINSTLELIDSI